MLRTMLRIGQRIAAGYLVLLSLIFAVGAAGIFATESVVESVTMLYEHPFIVTSSLSDLGRDLMLMDSALTQALVFPENIRDPAWLKALADDEQDGDAALTRASERYLGPKADIQALRIAWSDWRGVTDPMIAALSKGDTPYARGLYQSVVHPQYAKTLAAQGTMLTFARLRAQKFMNASMSLRDSQRWGMGALLVAALSLGGVIIYLVSRSILIPLTRLSRGLSGIVSGNGAFLHKDIERGDEIGEMARQLENLRLSVHSRKRAELKYQTLFRNCPDMIIVSQRDSARFIEVNDAFERLLDYRRDEAVGRTAVELEIWVRPEERLHMLELLAENERLSGYEARFRRKDGQVVTILMSCERVELDSQDCLIVVARDISDRKREEETLRRMVDELAQSNTELARFAHVAAHDLQEPSRSICSYAQLLERRCGPQIDDEGREYLGFLVSGALRMRDLVSGLLDYSRAGTEASSFRRVELAELFNAAKTELQSAIVEKQAVIDVQGDLPAVCGDRVQLRQLFIHLLGNALKFQPEGTRPRVLVSVQGDGAWWHVAIRDNGIGIPPEHQEKVFEMFRRLHGPGRYPGTGLGLSLARRVVEAHGGRIWLESQPNQGTTVHLTLPADNLPERG